MVTSDTVAAVVVTYNRKGMLKECLSGILSQMSQVDALVIVDNHSTDGTPELLRELSLIPQIVEATYVPTELNQVIHSTYNSGHEIAVHYIRMHENVGSAGGFHEAVKRAYDKGYNWIWVMDDDVEPKSDCLSVLLSYSGQFKCLQPARVFLDGTLFKWAQKFNIVKLRLNLIENSSDRDGLIAVDTICFEGVLINRRVIEKIGLPDRRFFTVGDDTEYGLRISAAFKIAYVPLAVIVRKIRSATEEVNLLGFRSRRTPRNQYWKLFYSYRNLFLFRELHQAGVSQLSYILLHYLRHALSIMMFDADKIWRLRVLGTAFRDGLVGNYGRKEIE